MSRMHAFLLTVCTRKSHTHTQVTHAHAQTIEPPSSISQRFHAPIAQICTRERTRTLTHAHTPLRLSCTICPKERSPLPCAHRCQKPGSPRRRLRHWRTLIFLTCLPHPQPGLGQPARNASGVPVCVLSMIRNIFNSSPTPV